MVSCCFGERKAPTLLIYILKIRYFLDPVLLQIYSFTMLTDNETASDVVQMPASNLKDKLKDKTISSEQCYYYFTHKKKKNLFVQDYFVQLVIPL